MNAIARAVWFVESHLASSFDLEEIADAAGMSRFHLTRAFGQSLGLSVMRYARARRLSEAARRLANGAPDILTVALDAGYGSHEAFTRAFRHEFGTTPEEVRSGADLDKLELQEPILMTAQSRLNLADPHFVDAGPMLFVGLGKRYRFDAMGGIPGQWQEFNRHIGSIPNEKPGAAFGVCTNSDSEGMDYICAVEVTDFREIDRQLMRLRATPQRYAIFAHPGHISEIQAVFQSIYVDWRPDSGLEIAAAPTLERYGEGFDSASGRGGYEIWMPVRAKVQ